MRLLLVAVALSSSVSFAVRPGDWLYIVAKDTVLLKDADRKAKKVTTLQRGDEVKWLGPSEKNKQLHKVEARGKLGFVVMTALSPNRPAMEIDSATGKPMSAQAFASSNTANKDEFMGRGKPSPTPAQAELERVTALNREVTADALEAKRAELSK
ncbi:MAG: hypothetical protein ACO1OB_12770 [Archangium sp.]